MTHTHTHTITHTHSHYNTHTHRHTDLNVFICYTALLGRVILYYGFFRMEVSKFGLGGLVSCRVQLQP